MDDGFPVIRHIFHNMFNGSVVFKYSRQLTRTLLGLSICFMSH